MSRERHRTRHASRRHRTLVEILERRPMLNGSLPVVTVTALPATADVANYTNGAFNIARTGSTSGALTVDFSLGGSAQVSVDYIGGSGSPPGPGGGAADAATAQSGRAAATAMIGQGGGGVSVHGGGPEGITPGGSVTLSAGQASATILIIPINPHFNENSKTVDLALTAESAYQVGSPGSAEGHHRRGRWPPDDHRHGDRADGLRG